MKSLDNITVCPVKPKKSQCFTLDGVEFFFRKTKSVTEVYETSTLKLILVAAGRSNDYILNHLHGRLNEVKTALGI